MLPRHSALEENLEKRTKASLKLMIRPFLSRTTKASFMLEKTVSSRDLLSAMARSDLTLSVISRTTETDPMIRPSTFLTGLALQRRWRNSPEAGVRMISSWSITISPRMARSGGVSSSGRTLPSARRTSRLPASFATSAAPDRSRANSREAVGFIIVNFPSKSANQISSLILFTSAESRSFSSATRSCRRSRSRSASKRRVMSEKIVANCRGAGQ